MTALYAGRLSSAEEAVAQQFWEASEETAEQIGARFGVSKSTIIGIAHRRRWNRRRGSAPTSLHERLDGLERRCMAVIRANEGIGRFAYDKEKFR